MPSVWVIRDDSNSQGQPDIVEMSFVTASGERIVAHQQGTSLWSRVTMELRDSFSLANSTENILRPKEVLEKCGSGAGGGKTAPQWCWQNLFPHCAGNTFVYCFREWQSLPSSRGWLRWCHPSEHWDSRWVCLISHWPPNKVAFLPL